MPTENNNVVNFDSNLSNTITQPVTTPTTGGINTNTLVGGGVCAVAGAAILFIGERAWKWGKKLIAKHKAAKAEDVAEPEYVDGEIVEEEKNSNKSNKR